jgi:hypothetical protein
MYGEAEDVTGRSSGTAAAVRTAKTASFMRPPGLLALVWIAIRYDHDRNALAVRPL